MTSNRNLDAVGTMDRRSLLLGGALLLQGRATGGGHAAVQPRGGQGGAR